MPWLPLRPYADKSNKDVSLIGMFGVFLEIDSGHVYLLSLNLNTTGVIFTRTCSVWRIWRHSLLWPYKLVVCPSWTLFTVDCLFPLDRKGKQFGSMVIWTRLTQISHSCSGQAWYMVSRCSKPRWCSFSLTLENKQRGSYSLTPSCGETPWSLKLLCVKSLK